MTTPSSTQPEKGTPGAGGVSKLSLDTWAVALSLGISLLIWLGVIKHVPW